MAVMKTLREIAIAVADELQLTEEDVSINQVTIVVTYSVEHQPDFIDEWYENYLASLAEDVEVPF